MDITKIPEFHPRVVKVELLSGKALREPAAILLPSLTDNNHFLTPFRRSWFYPEPDGVKCGQEHECKDSSDGRSTDKRVCQRAPEDRERERNESKHGGQRGKNDGS